MPKRMRKVLEDLYRQYNAAGTIWVVWHLLVADGKYDINVSPDKREVVLSEEKEVVTELTAQLTEIFEQ